MNLGGIWLVIIGVFVFANALSGKSFVVGNLRIPGSTDVGMFFIALGLILLALAFITDKIFRKRF